MNELLWMATGSAVTILVSLMYVGIVDIVEQRRKEEAIWREQTSPSDDWMTQEVEKQRKRNIDDLV